MSIALSPASALPVERTCFPSRDVASDSTVLAGKISVSITTGETVGSLTKMSGRAALPFNIPVFSELTIFDFRQAWRVFLSSSAKASLIVCSVVGMVPSHPPSVPCYGSLLVSLGRI